MQFHFSPNSYTRPKLTGEKSKPGRNKVPLFRFKSIGYYLDSMKGYFVADLNSSFYSIYYIIVFILRFLFPTCDKSYSLIGVTERHCDMLIYQR